MSATPEQIAALIDSPYRDCIPQWKDLPKDPVRRVTLLRKSVPASVAPVILELSELRHRGREKFGRACEMFFDREALEQSSSEAIAALRAEAFKDCETVADLTCGIGGDTSALARQCRKVIASDLSAARVSMSQWNVEALCAAASIRGEVSFRTACAQNYPLADGYFLDPSRRASGRKSRFLRDLSPPVELVKELAATSDSVGVKLSAATPDEELLALGGSIDFVASAGVCREAFVRLGRLSTGTTRALFPKRGGGWSALSATPGSPGAPLSEPLKFLLEPNPAIIRASLLPELCRCVHAAILDPESAYLTAERPCPDSSAMSYEIHRSLPFSLKGVKSHLREIGIGHVEVKKRGIDADVEEVRRHLQSKLNGHGVVVLMRLSGKPWAFICSAVPIGAD
ncbi:MAG: hypothetical protein IT209_03770 [Armatimonadetes bacterium]|nr:hypothetical protein [Armatimonadota bacterium]